MNGGEDDAVPARGRRPAKGPRRGGWSRAPREGEANGAEAETPAEMHRRAYATSIKLLGARDHSSAELRRKLAERDVEPDTVDAVLAELAEHRYVDDARYARLYAEQRAEQGHGPRSIESKLAERGLEAFDVRAALEALGADWAERAEAALVGKFRDDQIVDPEPRARARIARFLQGRGFSDGDSIRAVDAARARIVAAAGDG